jgi:RHS repeat-associated protein
LPKKIVLEDSLSRTCFGSREIEYIYDAVGIKLAKITYGEESGTVRTDYAGSYVYENSHLQYQLFPEGRKLYDSDNNSWQYEYHLKDHLGNVRVAFDETGNIAQENHYYPFGLRISDLGLQNSDNKYLYNGKEIDAEFDLNWYHYGFRMYDPVIGRFPSLDPKADEFAWVSPYNYAENSPIANIDLWGLQMFPGFGYLTDMAVNALENEGYSGAAGFVESYGHSLVADPVYDADQIIQTAQDDGAVGVLKDVSGVSGVVGAINTVDAALSGDSKAVGNVAGMVPAVAGMVLTGGKIKGNKSSQSKITTGAEFSKNGPSNIGSGTGKGGHKVLYEPVKQSDGGTFRAVGKSTRNGQFEPNNKLRYGTLQADPTKNGMYKTPNKNAVGAPKVLGPHSRKVVNWTVGIGLAAAAGKGIYDTIMQDDE